MGLGWPRVGHSPREKEIVCFNTVMGTAPEVQDVVQWSFERNELITLYFSKVFEHICAEGVTNCSVSLCCEKASLLLESTAEVNREEDRKLKREACEI